MIDRIKKILKYYKLSSSKFADEIGIQRSSISHVLSGRNKPSLDFIQKILNTYSEVNSDWLLMGIGKLNKEESESQNLFDNESSNSIKMNIDSEFSDSKSDNKEKTSIKSQIIKSKNAYSAKGIEKRVKKIIILNDDNTFTEYYPENY